MNDVIEPYRSIQKRKVAGSGMLVVTWAAKRDDEVEGNSAGPIICDPETYSGGRGKFVHGSRAKTEFRAYEHRDVDRPKGGPIIQINNEYCDFLLGLALETRQRIEWRRTHRTVVRDGRSGKLYVDQMGITQERVWC